MSELYSEDRAATKDQEEERELLVMKDLRDRWVAAGLFLNYRGVARSYRLPTNEFPTHRTYTIDLPQDIGEFLADLATGLPALKATMPGMEYQLHTVIVPAFSKGGILRSTTGLIVAAAGVPKTIAGAQDQERAISEYFDGIERKHGLKYELAKIGTGFKTAF